MTPITASGSQILGLGSQAITEGLTLVRLRGLAQFWLNTGSASGSSAIGAFGIGIAQENQFGVGITAVQKPIADIDWEGWLFWMPIQLSLLSSTVQWGNAGTAAQDILVDTKAMRKLDEGDVVFAIVEIEEVGTIVLEGSFFSRLLVKLP